MTIATDVHARDLMQEKVILLSADAPIEEAVETFEEYKISGAPVVDSAGNTIGVLSAFDIARAEHVREGRIESGHGRWYHADPLADDEFDVDPQFRAEGYGPAAGGDRATVADWMTRELVTVTPEATLGEVCRTMAEHSIHRVLVVSERRLRGIVTSFDVVRCLAKP